MTTPRVTVPVEPTLPLHPESVRIATALRAEAERLGKGVPSDLPGFHKDLWTAAEIIDMAEQGRAFDHQMNAMLSAAPAPEGGAVKLSNEQIQSVMLEAVKEVRATVTDHVEAAAMDADIARMKRGPVDMGATGWEVMRAVHRRLAALATREEAPAEAGERKQLDRLFYAGGEYVRADEAVRQISALKAELSALRAQPPAREGWVK